MGGTGFQFRAKFRAKILPRNANFRTAECQGLKTVAWFVAFGGKFMSGTVRSVAFRGQILPRIWHSAVCLSSECQGLKTVARFVASAEIWARNLAKDWIPLPAILHRQLPCLLRHNFLTHNFPAVKPWCGKLFRPKLSTQGLIWNSISWHYTFKYCTVLTRFLFYMVPVLSNSNLTWFGQVLVLDG
jgi:hypothetical protein